MSFVLHTERVIVRRMCANPDTVEIGNSDIDAILSNECLRWINDRRPGAALTYFTTVADQQDYNVKPSGAYRIREVWWLSESVEVFSPSLKYIPSSVELTSAFAGFNVFDNPSIVAEFQKRITEYANAFKGKGWELENGYVRLEPIPGGGDRVYFEYTYPRWSAITSIPDELREAVRFFAASQVMSFLSIKRGLITAGKNFTGGGGSREESKDKEFLEKAEALAPYLGSTFFRG